VWPNIWLLVEGWERRTQCSDHVPFPGFLSAGIPEFYYLDGFTSAASCPTPPPPLSPPSHLTCTFYSTPPPPPSGNPWPHPVAGYKFWGGQQRGDTLQHQPLRSPDLLSGDSPTLQHSTLPPTLSTCHSLRALPFPQGTFPSPLPATLLQ
jgi:hypothetical protein